MTELTPLIPAPSITKLLPTITDKQVKWMIIKALLSRFRCKIFARCCGSSGNAQADPEEVEKKRQRRRLLNHVLMYTHLTMLAVCTIWYLRHGAPHGRGHPT